MKKSEMITVKQDHPEKIKCGGIYDIIVIGGGFAGVAAAVAAARMKQNVMLIDKRVMLGGLGTAGMISHYLALCDGFGRKIIRGLSEELMHAVIRYGYDTLSDEWRSGPEFVENPSKRYDTWFSIPEGAAALEELMISENVTILYDALLSDVIMSGATCEYVITEEKGGKTAYKAQVFIDASGDAVLFGKCGANTVSGESLVSYGAHHMDTTLCSNALESGNIKDALEFRWYGDFPVPGRVRRFPTMKVEDSTEETEFIIKGRSVYLESIKEKGKQNSRCTVLWPSMMMARKVRRIEGEYTLMPEDKDRHVEDSIGCISDWRNPGPVYEIPFRALYTGSLHNVLACGRCISSDGDAWEVTRVIPPAALTGQAAGTAATMICKEGKDICSLDVGALQEKLSKDKVLIHF